MKIRRVTIEVEVPWDAVYENVGLPKPLDSAGVLHAVNRGFARVCEDMDDPLAWKARVIKEEEVRL